MSSDLKWNCHITEIVKKASTRPCFLRQPKPAKIADKELVIFCTTYIRSNGSITKHACLVFHNGLSKYLSEELERIQKRALLIIYPFASYTDDLEKCDLPYL